MNRCADCVLRGLFPQSRNDCPTAWQGVCPLPPRPARIAYVANESFAECIDGTVYYCLAEIVEGEPGWRSACSCVDLEVLQHQAAERNAANGVSADDAQMILASSIAVSRIR
jgi:hypothetical protein